MTLLESLLFNSLQFLNIFFKGLRVFLHLFDLLPEGFNVLNDIDILSQKVRLLELIIVLNGLSRSQLAIV